MLNIQRIPLKGAHNTRDLGGIMTENGQTIVSHRLIRSGALCALTEKDKRILLDEYQLNTVIDFRSTMERKENPDPVLPGVNVLFHPVVTGDILDVSQTRGADGSESMSLVIHALKAQNMDAQDFMIALYRKLVSLPHAIAQYRAFFDVLLENRRGAVLWHCTAGKDRAGIAAALVLFALGVGEADILQDYLKSNTFIANDAPNGMRDMQHVTDAFALRPLFVVQQAYLMAALETIRDAFGGMDTYLQHQMNLSPKKRQELKRMYLF